MRHARIISILSVTLAVAAGVGPPAAAASGEGGGAVAGGTVAPSGDSGGATYGAPVPKAKAEAPKPKRAKRRAQRAATKQRSAAKRRAVPHGEHVFPLAGSFDWGNRDSRFGAGRKGHRHQGQDLPAAIGTPVVAPHAGTIEAVDFQAKAAGNYVVLDSSGEDFSYVFMHLRTGSIDVVVGQRVRAGQRLGAVGSTGRSTGPHLHFEIWSGGWYVGGHPIDPLPLLKSWAG
jgi:murein DD-endopeptidase MepM/ murein hydrolase activator NlpD